MSKCMYCHKEMENLYPAAVGKEKKQITCCSEVCVNKSEKFFNFFDRTKALFIIMMIFAMAVLFAGAIVIIRTKMIGSLLLSIGFGLIGLDAVIFPFATPETFRLMGIQRATILTRIIGAAIVACSPLLYFFLMS